MNANPPGDNKPPLKSNQPPPVGSLLLPSPYAQLSAKDKRHTDQTQPFAEFEAENYAPSLMANSECASLPFSMSPRDVVGESQANMLYNPYLYGVNNANYMVIPQNHVPYYGVQHGRSKSDIPRTVFCTKHQGKHPNNLLLQSGACCFLDNCVADCIPPAAQSAQSKNQEQQASDILRDADPVPEQKNPTRIICNRRVSRQSLHKYTVCSNCGTDKTSLWRRSSSGEPLCNACGLFRKLHGSSRPISLKTDVIRKRNRSRVSVLRNQLQHNAGSRFKNRAPGLYSSFVNNGDHQVPDIRSPLDGTVHNQQSQGLAQDTSQRQCETRDSDEHPRYDYAQRQNVMADSSESSTRSETTHDLNSNEIQRSSERHKGSHNSDHHARQKSDQSRNTNNIGSNRFSFYNYNMIDSDLSEPGPPYWSPSNFNTQSYNNPSAVLQHQAPQNSGGLDFDHSTGSNTMFLDLNTHTPVVSSNNLGCYFTLRDHMWQVDLPNDSIEGRTHPADSSRFPLGSTGSSPRSYLRPEVHRRSISGDIITKGRHSATGSVALENGDRTPVKNYCDKLLPLLGSMSKTSPPNKHASTSNPTLQKDFSAATVNCASFDVYGRYRENFRAVDQHTGATGTDLHSMPTQSHLKIQ